jgi:hypothetical protein
MSNPDDSDPAIDEIRAIRHEISARFDHDPRKLVEHYMQLQRRHADRLIAVGENRDTIEKSPLPVR